MALSVEYAAYTNSGASAVNSQVAGSAWGDIETKFDAWASAVASNASLTAAGHSITKEYGYQDRANPCFCYRFERTDLGTPANGNATVWTAFGFNGSNMSCLSGSNWSLTTSNGGMGTWSTSGLNHYSSGSWTDDTSTTSTYEYIIASDDTDGQEFFVVGNAAGRRSSASSYQGVWGVVRLTNGQWLFVNELDMFAWDEVNTYWTGNVGSYDTDPKMDGIGGGGSYRPLYFYIFSTGGYSGVSRFGGPWYPANQALIFGARSLGNYVNDATTQIVDLAYNNIAVRYTP